MQSHKLRELTSETKELLAASCLKFLGETYSLIKK